MRRLGALLTGLLEAGFYALAMWTPATRIGTVLSLIVAVCGVVGTGWILYTALT